MIAKQSLSYEWIREKREEFNNADPLLAEKAIRALTLLDSLCRQDLKFIFKGGTALLLLLSESLRFSIDVDIIVEERSYNFETKFKNVISQTDFTNYSEDRRNNMDIPKKHFKFYYQSVLPNQDEQYILLDVLLLKNPYPKLTTKSVEASFISIDGKSARVRLPDVNSILGDKLTAFAPGTIGIPLGNEKELEIIKQLYDIGELFNVVDDLNLIRKAFKRIAEVEIKFRDQTLKPSDALADIFYSSHILSLRGKKDETLYKELESGIRKIEPYIFKRFKIDDAILSSAKAAYLTQLLKFGINSFDRFDKSVDLSDRLIEGEKYNKLNKVKKTSPEAFYYWYKAIEMIKTN